MEEKIIALQKLVFENDFDDIIEKLVEVLSDTKHLEINNLKFLLLEYYIELEFYGIETDEEKKHIDNLFEKIGNILEIPDLVEYIDHLELKESIDKIIYELDNFNKQEKFKDIEVLHNQIFIETMRIIIKETIDNIMQIIKKEDTKVSEVLKEFFNASEKMNEIRVCDTEDQERVLDCFRRIREIIGIEPTFRTPIRFCNI
jgi:hypothetical protein